MSPRSLLSARFSRGTVRRLATRAFVGELGPRASRRLAEALRASERDRLAYGALAALYRAFEGARDDLARGQHERILAALRAEVAHEAGQRLAARRGATLLPALASALAAAAAVILLLVARPPASDELVPRGRSAPLAAGRVGLKAFCIRDGHVVPPPARETGEADARCRLSDELQLAVTHTASFSHLLVVGLMPGVDARELYYFPVPPDGHSGLVPRGEDAALGRAIRLAVNHRPGSLRIVALFSREPLASSQVHGWLRALPPDEPAPPLFARIAPSVEAVELRVTLEETRTPRRDSP